MDEIFAKRVRAAAGAGWWTLLIAYCILLIQWFAYLLIMTKHPAGVLCIWGEGATWQEIRTIWLWAMVAYKLGGRNDAICRNLAYALGKTTGKNVELTDDPIVLAV